MMQERVLPQRPPVPAGRMASAWRLLREHPAWLLAGAAAITAITVQGCRLSAAPDVFGDEGAYLYVGRSLANGAGLTGLDGLFLWHPPLYMLIEAAVIKTLGLGGAEPLSLLFTLRWINIVFSAATAGLLVLFACRLRGPRMAVIVGVLFVLDPYVQRINRRAMLETTTIFFVVLALYLFATGEAHGALRRWLLPGAVFGLALLTKEPAVIFLLVPIGYGLFGERSRLGDALRTVVTAAGVYLCYVAALAASGNAAAYWAYKWYEIQRIGHALTGTRAGAPPGGGMLQTAHKLLSEENLVRLAGQYAPSGLLIAVALVGAAVLTSRFRHDRRVRLPVVWMVVSLVSGVLLIRVSDQYVYYLIVPAILVAGFVLDAALGRWRQPPRRPVAMAMSALLLVGCAGFSGYRWAGNYVTGSDNCYSQVVAYVREHVPRGETIVTSNEVSSYFLGGRYDIRADRDPVALADLNVRVFILSSKDLWARNQGTTPEFYNWITHHSHRVFVCHSPNYWDTGVYVRGDVVGTPARAGAP